MSAIPPGWLASGVQSTAAQQRAAQAREKEGVNGPSALSSFTRQLDGAIETSDKDSQTDSEAQGNGGKGRSSQSQDVQPTEPLDEARQSDGPGGSLDIQA